MTLRMRAVAYIVLTAFALISFLPQAASGQTADPSAKIKTIFIYNFTKYIKWPEKMSSGPFIIGVLGESTIMPELKKMAKDKKAGAQDIEVRQFNIPSEVTACHLLILGERDSPMLADALTTLKDRNTLIVTEKESLTKKGAAISFKVVDNKQKFELNRNNLEKKGLQVNSVLLSLALNVE